jgi:hypothetical protein
MLLNEIQMYSLLRQKPWFLTNLTILTIVLRNSLFYLFIVDDNKHKKNYCLGNELIMFKFKPI